jgi:hypothetical protein
MTISFDEFARRCSALLKAEPGPAGRRKVRDLLAEVLRDPAFVEAVVPERTTDRELRYEDPDLKFCIFAEHKFGAKTGEPHDHGPSWAIYGQAAGTTRMSEWELVEPATSTRPGKVRLLEQYTMAPGSAFVYDEGVLHSPSRAAPTRLIRFEGMNLEALRGARPKYDVVS